MKHIHRLCITNGVDRTKSVALPVFDDLQYARAPKALERFGLSMFLSSLSKVQGVAKNILNVLSMACKSRFAAPTQRKRLGAGTGAKSYPNIDSPPNDHKAHGQGDGACQQACSPLGGRLSTGLLICPQPSRRLSRALCSPPMRLGEGHCGL